MTGRKRHNRIGWSNRSADICFVRCPAERIYFLRSRSARGEQACQDRSSRPKRLAWRVTEEERAIIPAARRATGLRLDDLTFVLRHFLPHLHCDNIYRVPRQRSASPWAWITCAASSICGPPGRSKSYTSWSRPSVFASHPVKMRDRESVERVGSVTRRFIHILVCIGSDIVIGILWPSGDVSPPELKDGDDDDA